MKPPAILPEDIKTAEAPKSYPTEPGKNPPPKIKSPPAAVSPDIALVTDISGVWRAGVTDHTDWYPLIAAKVKVVIIPRKIGSGLRIPAPMKVDNPKPVKIEFLTVDFHGSTVVSFLYSFTTFFFPASSIGSGSGQGHFF